MPWLPAIVSSPEPPSGSNRIAPALRAEASILSLPSREWTSSSSVGSGWRILTVEERPLTFTSAASPLTSTASSRFEPLTTTLVGLAVAGGAAQRARQIDVDIVDVGAAEVVDRDEVGAAERVEVDLLDAVRVHRDGGDARGRT